MSKKILPLGYHGFCKHKANKYNDRNEYIWIVTEKRTTLCRDKRNGSFGFVGTKHLLHKKGHFSPSLENNLDAGGEH